MEDRIAVGDDVVELAPSEIERDELESVPVAERPQVAELVGPGVVVVEAIDAEHLDAVVEEDAAMGADEPGAAGDERRLHGMPINAAGRSKLSPPRQRFGSGTVYSNVNHARRRG